jgi:hypothetical protein
LVDEETQVPNYSILTFSLFFHSFTFLSREEKENPEFSEPLMTGFCLSETKSTLKEKSEQNRLRTSHLAWKYVYYFNFQHDLPKLHDDTKQEA